MSGTAHTFWLARGGNAPAQYEDAFAVNAVNGRYALADGATESCFAGLWARLLVEGFVEGREADAQFWPTTISRLQGRWDEDVRSRKLPWHARPSVRQGAFSTFLGVSLSADRWQVIAVGDTCLFHTRDSVLLRAFPLEQSQQFNNAPKLVGSRTPPENLHERQCLWTDGYGQAGDWLWMATDALAQWCLCEQEAGGNPWSTLVSFVGESDANDRFTGWIEGLREAGRLRNDDVTLLGIPLRGE